MAKQEIIDKQNKIDHNKIIITKTIKETLSRSDLENQLMIISKNKYKIKMSNQRLKEQYNKLIEMENEIKELLFQIDNDDTIEDIE